MGIRSKLLEDMMLNYLFPSVYKTLIKTFITPKGHVHIHRIHKSVKYLYKVFI